MREKTTRAPIKNEADNGLRNRAGTIAMARTSDPHSATSQFFINLVDNDFLDFRSESTMGWGYCVFGEVIDGMDVVRKIKDVPTGSYGMHQDVPLADVLILGTTIEGEAQLSSNAELRHINVALKSALKELMN